MTYVAQITDQPAESGLQSGSSVTQLEMVPLTEDHSASGVIQSNRMLMISGSLLSDSFGTASSALYDGAQFYPYIVTSTASGSPGFVSSMIHSFSSFSFDARSKFVRLFLVLVVHLVYCRIPRHRSRYSRVHRHRRWHCLLIAPYWCALDSICPS